MEIWGCLPLHFAPVPMQMTVSRTICFGFLVLIIIGTLLLLLPFSTASGNWNNPLVALFTATSAVCVTG
jgi:trk system potassium uptake protein TrkH